MKQKPARFLIAYLDLVAEEAAAGRAAARAESGQPAVICTCQRCRCRYWQDVAAFAQSARNLGYIGGLRHEVAETMRVGGGVYDTAQAFYEAEVMADAGGAL